MSVQNIDAPDVEDRDQEAYRPRSAEDLEEVVSRMVSVDSEDEMEAVREISELADDQLRTGENSVNIHADAPIRSLNNPEENTVELEDQQAQVVAEEYFVGQNLPGFQDVGNIKWWTVMDDDSYREETRTGGREHLTLDNEGDIHNYRVELDGEVLDGEDVQRLARNLRIRSQRDVTTENSIPENILRHGSKSEVLENEDLTEQEYQEQLSEALNHGFISEEGDLTLKGWTVGTNLDARDLRQLDDLNYGSDIVEFQNDSFTGLDLDPAELGARATIDVFNEHFSGNEVRTIAERGMVDLEEGQRFPEEVREFMEEYGFVGFSTDSSPLDRQEVSEEIMLSDYLETVEDTPVSFEDGRLRIKRDQVDNFIYRQLNDTAKKNTYDDSIIISDVDVDYEVSLSVLDPASDEETSLEESDIPEELFDEIEKSLREDIEFDTRGNLNGYFHGRIISSSDWSREFSKVSDDLTTEFSESTTYNSLVSAVLWSRHSDELEELREGYGHSNSHGVEIPYFDEASQDLMETVEELEEHGFVQTADVRTGHANLDITADQLEYRETIERLEDLDSVEFKDRKELSWYEESNERVDLTDAKAKIEVLEGKEDEVAERLEDYRDEIMDEIGINTQQKVKDQRGPQFKNYIHNELEAGTLGDVLSKITPDMTYEDKESIPDYEGWSQRLWHPAGEKAGDSNWETRASEGLMEELEDMYIEGLIDGDLDYDIDSDRERKYDTVRIPGEARINDYRDLDQREKQELQELDQEGLIDLNETDYHLALNTREYTDDDGRIDFEPDEKIKAELDFEAESTELEMEDTPVELEGEYDITGDTTYRANENLREIAENLDPMNFESRPHEQVTVDTEFDYEQELPA